MRHLIKGIRATFYDQGTLEKRGWDLTPSEQRKFENWGGNVISAMFSGGLCVFVLCAILIVQTDASFNQPMVSNLWLVALPAFICFVLGLIGALTKKN